MFRMTFTAAALSLWIPQVCMAGTEILTVGDAAPDFDVAHWLKGEAVKEIKPGEVCVLEFWATWCSSCRASIPHLTELQGQYRDYKVTVVGVSDEPLQTVVKFLSKKDSSGQLWNEKIGYTLATDPDASAKKSYMTPAAQDTIPTAFIIGKDGRIEWIGSPTEIDGPLAEVVADRWDRAAFAAAYEARVAPIRRAMQLIETTDWQDAQAAIGELVEEQPEYDYLKGRLFRKMLHNADPAVTYAYGRAVMREHWDDSSILNQLAWHTVDDADVKDRDLVFAMEAARRASELKEDAEPGILDTVARVYFEMGDMKSAVEWQCKAAEKAKGTTSYDLIAETLEKYEKIHQE